MGEQQPHVLIVDDDASMRLMMNDSLGQMSSSITETYSGEEALKFFSGNKPDVILLDVCMPGKNGYKVCKTIREDSSGKYIPIIVVTGNNEMKYKHFTKRKERKEKQ